MPESLHLYKPHGSINLLESSKDEYADAQNSYNVRNLTILETNEDSHVLQAADPRDVANRTLYPFSTDDWLIVPPGARKSFKSHWIKKQWKLALDAMRNSQEITVIGYSLPEFDVRSRLLFRLAIAHRHENALPLIRIVDPNPGAVVTRVQECGYSRVESIATPWEEWLPFHVNDREFREDEIVHEV
jgi:hypothetical protein